jgi:hypothetical protein
VRWHRAFDYWGGIPGLAFPKHQCGHCKSTDNGGRKGLRLENKKEPAGRQVLFAQGGSKTAL